MKNCKWMKIVDMKTRSSLWKNLHAFFHVSFASLSCFFFFCSSYNDFCPTFLLSVRLTGVGQRCHPKAPYSSSRTPHTFSLIFDFQLMKSILSPTLSCFSLYPSYFLSFFINMFLSISDISGVYISYY